MRKRGLTSQSSSIHINIGYHQSSPRFENFRTSWHFCGDSMHHCRLRRYQAFATACRLETGFTTLNSAMQLVCSSEYSMNKTLLMASFFRSGSPLQVRTSSPISNRHSTFSTSSSICAALLFLALWPPPTSATVLLLPMPSFFYIFFCLNISFERPCLLPFCVRLSTS